jgi:hypothetical protein
MLSNIWEPFDPPTILNNPALDKLCRELIEKYDREEKSKKHKEKYPNYCCSGTIINRRI